MRTDDDDGKLVSPHDLAQGLHAVHARHLQIERDHMRMQFFNLLQPEFAVHGRADDLDPGIAFDDLRDQLAHQCGIVDDQDSYRRAHADAPALRSALKSSATLDLPRRATTEFKFKISTTVPSPRMEAPLTKSVATKWSSSALITNSSSP